MLSVEIAEITFFGILSLYSFPGALSGLSFISKDMDFLCLGLWSFDIVILFLYGAPLFYVLFVPLIWIFWHSYNLLAPIYYIDKLIKSLI